jgi:acylphosphatase
MKQIKATIHGRVQGVFFRETTRQEAQRLGLTGWAKNERDGTVSVVAVGKEENLKKLAAFLHQGPPAAHVDQVELQWMEPDQEFSRFDVRW